MRGGKRKTKVSKTIQELLEESARDDLIVTTPYNQFLHSNWDESFSPRVIQRLSEILSTKQRDRRYTWSASGAGRCKRRQEFAFLGMPTVDRYDPQLRRIFLNGTWVHLRNQAVLMEAGILDNIEVTHKKKSMRARCTMDGIGVALTSRYKGADFGYELKSANDFSYQNQLIKGPLETTLRQVDFQFMLTGLDLFVIFHENKNNQDIHEWVIVRDEDRVEAAREEVKELNFAVDRPRLHSRLPECQKKLRSGEFYKCPFGGDGGVCANVGTWPNGIP